MNTQIRSTTRVHDIFSVQGTYDDPSVDVFGNFQVRRSPGFTGNAHASLRAREVEYQNVGDGSFYHFGLADNWNLQDFPTLTGAYSEIGTYKATPSSSVWDSVSLSANYSCGPNPCTTQNRDFEFKFWKTAEPGFVYFDNAFVRIP